MSCKSKDKYQVSQRQKPKVGNLGIRKIKVHALHQDDVILKIMSEEK